MAAVKALQQWCKMQCEGYTDVSISNMTTSFRDGLAFCALLHRHRPELIDFDSLSKENVYENNQLAFRVAEEELSIPALLDAEDMVAMKVPDRLSILTYVSQYYNYFHGRSPIGGLAGVKRPAEEPMDRTSGVKNQPVSTKAFSSVKPQTDTKRDVPVERSEKSGTINRNCSVCNEHVHLVQRHLVDGKLYHRNCFKCSECFSILLSGTYKPGKEPNTFICRSHHNTQKPSPARDAPPARYSQAIPTTKNNTTSTESPAARYSQATPTSTNTKNNISTISTKSPPAHYRQATPTTTSTNTTSTNTTSTNTKNNISTKSPPARYSQATPTTTSTNTTSTNTTSTNTTSTNTKNNISTKSPPARYSQATPTTTTTTKNNINTTVSTTKSPLNTKDITNKGLGKDSTQHKPGLFGLLSKTGSSSTPSPALTPALTPAPAAAPCYKPTSSPSVTVTVKSPAEQKVLSETPIGQSSSVLKNLEARQRFFESSSSPVSPVNSVSVSRGTTATAANDKLGAGGAGAAGGAGKGKQLLRADDWIKDKRKEKENDGDKEKAKSVISKFVTDETSRSSSSSSPHTLRWNTQSNVSPVPAASKAPNTRVLLKPPVLDLELSTNPSLSKTSSWLRSTEKSPARAASTPPSDSKESDAAPSDWRALLKPVAKNTNSSQDPTPTSLTQGAHTPKDPTPKDPKTSNTGSRPWDSQTKRSSPSSTASLSTNISSTKSPATPSRGTEAALRGGVSSASPSQKPWKPDYIPQEEILRELKEIEMKLDDLEKTGVELEKQLRQCEEENQEDVLMNDLMVDWFNLIRNKQLYIRRESELVYIGRSQDLEEEQPNVEAELRKLIEKPEHLKTSRDKKREEELMEKLMEIVNDRNAIVDGLDEDRLREEEEDEELKKMMKNLDMKKEKKRRSSKSWSFSWRSKHDD